MLEEITSMYDGAVDSMLPGARTEAVRDRDESYKEIDRWIRGARAKVRRRTHDSPAPYRSNSRISSLERIPLPQFQGLPEQWPDFKHQFLELTDNQGLGPAVLLAHLWKNLPQEARMIIADRAGVEEAWEALDQRYDNTNLAIINTKAKLAHLDTGKGEDFDKVEKMRQGVTEAKSTLRALGVEEEILND